MSCALIPGSFDPITVGHLDIIQRAAALYDSVVVAVMINEQKEYAFSLEERTQMVRIATESLSTVRVVSDTGLLIDLFDRVGADVIVKGVRNEADSLYEQRMADWNRAHNPRVKTVFLQAADDYVEVSSTAARARMRDGEIPEGLLPPAVAAYALQKFGGERRE